MLYCNCLYVVTAIILYLVTNLEQNYHRQGQFTAYGTKSVKTHVDNYTNSLCYLQLVPGIILHWSYNYVHN